MIKLSTVFLFLFFCFQAGAQTSTLGCGNGRYISDVFATVNKTTGITYGNNTITSYNPPGTFPVTLKFDFYEPSADPALKRPIIILAFGGAFISGTRSDLNTLCTALAKKGYAVATIDYRLIYPSFTNIATVYSSPSLLEDEVIKASVDMKAAIRFFKKDAATTNTYKIDSTKIFVGGYSAGAITALQTAYCDDINEFPPATPAYASNGGFEGNTDLPAPNNLLPAYNSSGIAGVFNISGGVADTSLVDAYNPPIFSTQGNADEVVPYDSGYVTFNGTPTVAYLYGSHTIQRRATAIGLNNQLNTIASGNHASPFVEPAFTQMVNAGAIFLAPLVCGQALPVTLTTFTAENKNCDVLLRWQTASEKQGNYYDIETAADGMHFTKAGTVQGKSALGGSAYNYTVSGFAGKIYFRLKMVEQDGSYTYSPVQKLTRTCGSPAVQVYPNPARTDATVSGLAAGSKVRLMNAEGKTLWLQTATGNTVQLPVAGLAGGLYLVQVVGSHGELLLNTKLTKE